MAAMPREFNRFCMKLFGRLNRRYRAGTWLAFSSPLLAILPDCPKGGPAFYLMPFGLFDACRRPAKMPAIVTVARSHF